MPFGMLMITAAVTAVVPTGMIGIYYDSLPFGKWLMTLMAAMTSWVMLVLPAEGFGSDKEINRTLPIDLFALMLRRQLIVVAPWLAGGLMGLVALFILRPDVPGLLIHFVWFALLIPLLLTGLGIVLRWRQMSHGHFGAFELDPKDRDLTADGSLPGTRLWHWLTRTIGGEEKRKEIEFRPSIPPQLRLMAGAWMPIVAVLAGEVLLLGMWHFQSIYGDPMFEGLCVRWSPLLGGVCITLMALWALEIGGDAAFQRTLPLPRRRWIVIGLTLSFGLSILTGCACALLIWLLAPWADGLWMPPLFSMAGVCVACLILVCGCLLASTRLWSVLGAADKANESLDLRGFARIGLACLMLLAGIPLSLIDLWLFRGWVLLVLLVSPVLLPMLDWEREV